MRHLGLETRNKISGIEKKLPLRSFPLTGTVTTKSYMSYLEKNSSKTVTVRGPNPGYQKVAVRQLCINNRLLSACTSLGE